MKIKDILERNVDPVALAKRVAKKYGTKKDYGYVNSDTNPGEYIPLKSYDDDLVDELEDALNKLYKLVGWKPGTKNLPEIRKSLSQKFGIIKDIQINKLTATQPFVRISDEETLKQKVDSNKTISVSKYQNRFFIMDGHHAVLSASLRGEKLINAKITDIDLALSSTKDKTKKYTAREWQIISGGHTLEETTEPAKIKLFDFGKY